jgi:bifunctional ADP-heptose synthase (sugar kinase/adenylyltransferase)
VKVLVIGERAVDIYNYGSVDRICPEGLAFVLVPKSKFVYPGMAENVVENIKSLRPNYRIDFFTQDHAIKKERFCDEERGHLLLRVDEGDEIPEGKCFCFKKFEKFLKEKNGRTCSIESFHEYYDAVVFSDYDKGFIGSTQIRDISENIDGRCPIFMDTKKVLGEWSSRISFIKINKKEYESCLRENPSAKVENLIVTLGRSGAKFIGGGEEKVVDCFNTVPNDVSGAGDSYLAGLLVNYLENDNNILKAMGYASVVAGISVSKRGTSTVTEQEIIDKK